LVYDNKISSNEVIQKTKYNAPRFVYQFIGLDGLPRVIQNTLYPIKANLFQKIFVPSRLNLQKEVYLQPGYNENEKFIYTAPLILSEESAWFGPVGFLLIPLALILAFFSNYKNSLGSLLFSAVV